MQLTTRPLFCYLWTCCRDAEDQSFFAQDSSVQPPISVHPEVSHLSAFDAKYEFGTLCAMAASRFMLVGAEIPDRNAQNDPWPAPLFDDHNALPPRFKVVSEAKINFETKMVKKSHSPDETSTTLVLIGSHVYTRQTEHPWTSEPWNPSDEHSIIGLEELRQYQEAWFNQFMTNQGVPHIDFSFATLNQLALELEKPENAAGKAEFEQWAQDWCGGGGTNAEEVDTRSEAEKAATTPEHEKVQQRELYCVTRAFAHLLLSTPNEPISDKVPPLEDPLHAGAPLLRTWHIDPHGRTIVMVSTDGGWFEAERYAAWLRETKNEQVTVATIPAEEKVYTIGEHRYVIIDMQNENHRAFWFDEFNVRTRKFWSFQVRKQIARFIEVRNTPGRELST
jgi:hypothetical protein